MSGKFWIVLGILLAGLSVILGAFGAHGLETYLKELEPAEYAKKIDQWKTGAMYQFFHALGIIAIGIVGCLDRSRRHWSLNLAAVLMLIGVALFSGLLYLLVLVDFRGGMLIPIGGVALIVGWVFFAIGAASSNLGE